MVEIVVPGDPHTVGGAELAVGEERIELLGTEADLDVSATFRTVHVRIIVGVDDQLALHGNCLVLVVVEKDPSTKATGSRGAGRGEDVRGPNRRHSNRFAVLFLQLRFFCFEDDGLTQFVRLDRGCAARSKNNQDKANYETRRHPVSPIN